MFLCFIFQEGVGIERLGTLTTDLGFPMSITQLADEVGLAVCLHSAEVMLSICLLLQVLVHELWGSTFFLCMFLFI